MTSVPINKSAPRLAAKVDQSKPLEHNTREVVSAYIETVGAEVEHRAAWVGGASKSCSPRSTITLPEGEAIAQDANPHGDWRIESGPVFPWAALTDMEKTDGR